ncbi:MAG: hypothetical protein Q4C49_04440 [Bacillota bacterium]|nr:hypothetical protein [Bacillota bacterium]
MRKGSKIVIVGLLATALAGCSQVNDFMDEFVLKKDNNKTEQKETKKKEVKETKETKEKKTEEVVEVEKEDSTVYDTDVINLLNNQAVYNGKLVRVKGILPEGKIADTNNVEMFGLLAEDGSTFIQIKGIEPNIFNCKAWVCGKAVLEGEEIVIEATSYEKIEDIIQEPVVQEEVQEPVIQETTPPSEQKYYYVVINGERVFLTPEGQQIWDKRQQKEQENQ